MKGISEEWLDERIDQALREDLGSGDVTSRAASEYDPHVQAEIIARQSGVIAGLPVTRHVFERSEIPLDIQEVTKDGQPVKNGQQLMVLEGSGRLILGAERTALNLLGRMSGVATLTQQYVKAVEGTGTTILDTRKTTPHWRDLEKYAVRMGGGVNHRMGLYDMILLKENHIRWAGGLGKALSNAVDYKKSRNRSVPIEVEVQTIEELEKALTYKIDRILLDNMSVEQIAETVSIANGKIPLEVSGGVTLETVHEYAETGVDYISVGALTHSVQNFDVSLLFKEQNLPPGQLADQEVTGGKE